MKRAAITIAILLSTAGIAWLQTPAPKIDLATLMPSGGLLYLQAADFKGLFQEWNGSTVKRDWLASDNYAVFQQSNLFSKLGDVCEQYSAAMAVSPGFHGIAEIAGSESALTLYDIHGVEFLYISRVAESELTKAQLWAARSKFEQREVGGVPFWLRTDRASGRTVGFAYAKGWLFVATRDDLIARALQLLAGGNEPSVASEGWYAQAVASVKTTGELRLVMNLEALARSDYFRSYWVQRNVSKVRQYWTAVSDVNRNDAGITESRVLLRSMETRSSGPPAEDRTAVARLVALAPESAGLYRAWASPKASTASGLIIDKLIAPPPAASDNSRYAPASVDLSQTAGTEADLETRIDEQALPSESTLTESAVPLRNAIEKAGIRAMLHIQSTASAGQVFVRMPCAIVLAASSPWDQTAVETALSRAAEPLWTSAGLGAGWQDISAGNVSERALNGLAKLYLASRGNLLYLASDPALLGAILDRADTRSMAPSSTYAAAFRFARERGNYNRLMTALDFASPEHETGFAPAASSTMAPLFFSQDLASLARVLSLITEVRIGEEDNGDRVLQQIEYTARRRQPQERLSVPPRNAARRSASSAAARRTQTGALMNGSMTTSTRLPFSE